MVGREVKSAPLKSLSEKYIHLRALLAKYNEEDIYNADETGLFFRIEPNQTLSFYFNPKRLEKDDDEEMLDECDNEQELSQNHRKKKIKKKAPELTNIELVYLPSNITAHLQPMDAGIIYSFKAKYKEEFCKYLIRQFDSGIDYVKNKLNIKEAIDYITEGWNNVTQKTIRNCWIKTDILSTYDDDDIAIDEEDFELNVDKALIGSVHF
ncbi:unnamed protein product [Rhizophagus irregularis]|nr:unnamed protein product [Rhizophagus irregularis]